MFSSAWSLISRVIPARTAKKVRFVSLTDTPSTLMRYVQPVSIVGLQRLSWGDDGDIIADEVAKYACSTSFSRMIEVAGRGTEHVYVALCAGQKCSFRVLDDAGKDITGFADVLHVSSDQHIGITPDEVVVHRETLTSRGSASCGRAIQNCLVVMVIENSAWFGSKSFKVNVQVFGPD